jgi:hypothetical protein
VEAEKMKDPKYEMRHRIDTRRAENDKNEKELKSLKVEYNQIEYIKSIEQKISTKGKAVHPSKQSEEYLGKRLDNANYKKIKVFKQNLQKLSDSGKIVTQLIRERGNIVSLRKNFTDVETFMKKPPKLEGGSFNRGSWTPRADPLDMNHLPVGPSLVNCKKSSLSPEKSKYLKSGNRKPVLQPHVRSVQLDQSKNCDKLKPMARPVIKISDSSWVKGKTRNWPNIQESTNTPRLGTDGPAWGNRNTSVHRMASTIPFPTDSMPEAFPGYNSGMDSYFSLGSSLGLDSSRQDLLPHGLESTPINLNRGNLASLSRMTKSRRGIIDSNRCKKYVYGVSKAGQVYIKKPTFNKSKGSMEFGSGRNKPKKVEGGMTPREWYSDRKVQEELVEKGKQNG